MGCCSQSSGPSRSREESKRYRIRSETQDIADGHLLRLAIPTRDPPPATSTDHWLYLHPKSCLHLLSRSTIRDKHSHEKFVGLLQKNSYWQVHRMVGLDEVAERVRLDASV